VGYFRKMSATAAAWVQAVGLIIAIGIAVWLPWWQRRRALRDALSDRARQEKEHLRRLAAGLRAEVTAAQDVIKYREFSDGETIKLVKSAQRSGANVTGNARIT
jgi:hypothetical protein